jgi:hypothetical protein
MKRGIVARLGLAALLALAAALAVSCSPDLFGSADARFGKGGSERAAAHGAPQNFRTHLAGDAEVPPRDTAAQGQAIFQLSKDGTELSYKLIASNILNITQAHIHLAPAGVNGGIVAWLYPSAAPAVLIPGRHDGVLAEGTITAASLVGALAGRPLADLVDALETDNAYVNVHTSQFPPGEIRGQVH